MTSTLSLTYLAVSLARLTLCTLTSLSRSGLARSPRSRARHARLALTLNPHSHSTLTPRARSSRSHSRSTLTPRARSFGSRSLDRLACTRSSVIAIVWLSLALARPHLHRLLRLLGSKISILKMEKLIKHKKLRKVQKMLKNGKDTSWGRDPQAKLRSCLIKLLIESACVQPPVSQLSDCQPEIRPAFSHRVKTILKEPGKRGGAKKCEFIECDPLVQKGLHSTHLVVAILKWPEDLAMFFLGKKPSYQLAATELGKELVEKNLVYGGGNVGLMGLVSQAVYDGGRHVLGPSSSNSESDNSTLKLPSIPDTLYICIGLNKGKPGLLAHYMKWTRRGFHGDRGMVYIQTMLDHIALQNGDESTEGSSFEAMAAGMRTHGCRKHVEAHVVPMLETSANTPVPVPQEVARTYGIQELAPVPLETARLPGSLTLSLFGWSLIEYVVGARLRKAALLRAFGADRGALIDRIESWALTHHDEFGGLMRVARVTMKKKIVGGVWLKGTCDPNAFYASKLSIPCWGFQANLGIECHRNKPPEEEDDDVVGEQGLGVILLQPTSEAEPLGT
ncbi:hypothetical protein Syun_009757 [Stephania yunnanensis]|uniref:DNA-directed RNA polymerase N-terminal domain-containing protein n=1 Tax=Stephania yunnanensis TaxID=152371 RepID=A0AAP0PNW4_9MAGN